MTSFYSAAVQTALNAERGREGERKMLRTRIVWFGLGFAASAAAISQFVYKDLWVDRHALYTEMKEKFDELEARVRNIEAVPSSRESPVGVVVDGH